MEFAIAKVSTKGQIVIPQKMRKGLETGEELLIVKDKETFILKSMDNIALDLKDDLKFAKRIEKAWREFYKGEFKSQKKDDFLEALDSC